MEKWKRPKKKKAFFKTKQVFSLGTGNAIYLSLKELDHLGVSPGDQLISVSNIPGVIMTSSLQTWQDITKEEENGIQE